MSLLPCIYCRRTGVPRTKEHVLQHALGASATLPTAVCDECNNAFSGIDKYFMDTLPFWYTDGNILRGLPPGHIKAERGPGLTVRVRSATSVHTFPQLVRGDDGTWSFHGEREEDFHLMTEELGSPSKLLVRSKNLKDGDDVPKVAVLKSARNKYLVQGSDHQAVDEISERLRTNGLRVTNAEAGFTGQDYANPTVHVPIVLSSETLSRALAKVALNFVCYRLGADTALRPEFDSLREFARNGVGTWNDYVSVMKPHSRVQNTERAFLCSKHHGLTLFRALHNGGQDVVSVVIEGRSVGHVRVNRVKELAAETWLLSRFDPERHTVENFELPKDMTQAVLSPDEAGPP